MGKSFSVAPIAVADVLPVARLLAESLDDDPAYRFLFPSVATRHRGLVDFFDRNLRTHLAYRCTYVLTDHEDPVGTVTIRPPGGIHVSPLTMLRRGLIPFAVTNGPSAVRRLFLLKREYDGIEGQVARGEAHRLVHMMAVSPNRQGRGVGTRLLREAISLSIDAIGSATLPILLTTHKERNVAFYRKNGFDVTERRELALAGAAAYPVWAMSRTRTPALGATHAIG